MIVGVVLAAGRSSRMGIPKALLRHYPTGSTFVGRLVGVLRAAGLDRVLVVGRPDERNIEHEVSRAGGVFVANARADDGQLSSILAALEAADMPEVDGILIVPVDMPLVSVGAVGALIAAARSSSASIIRAAHIGRHGHPVIFKRAVFEELYSADPAEGARAVVRRDPSRVLNVEVGDEGVTIDLDTPEDYERVFGRKL